MPRRGLVDVIVPIAVEDAATVTLGSQMRGSIALSTIDALVVPRAALFRDESGDYVFAVAEQAHRVDVESSSIVGLTLRFAATFIR